MKTKNITGYSGTALVKKLGIKDAQRILTINAPKEYAHLVAPIPSGVVFADKPTSNVDLVHLFVLQQEDLIRHLGILRKKLKPDAVVWVSWPKKSAKVATTITEDTIRDAALPLGFVDIKVCAVTEVWSGLKLVVRKTLR